MLKIEKIKNLNEIIFVWYIFSFLTFLPISKFVGINAYRAIFVINVLAIFVISVLKNKNILLKKDIVLLVITLIPFIIDFFFRKNQHTIEIYYNFIKKCYIPCYLFNRTSSIKAIIKYLAFFSKITIMVYLWDPLFNYYFSDTYMGYGGVMILPSFIAIYINYFINKKKIDIIFLIFSFLAIFIYGNRSCLLSIILMFILTSKLLLRSIKRLRKSKVWNDKLKNINKYLIVMTCVVVILVVIFLVATNINKDNSIFSKSYSLKKYEQLLSGQFETIFSGRTKLYLKAIDIIKNTASSNIWNLFLGNGTGYFMSVNDGVYTHSIIFDLIIEYGIVGFVIYFCTFIYCLIKWIKNSKKEKFLFGVYLLCLSFPKVLLSSSFQKETYLCLFILFVISYFSKDNQIKTNMIGEKDEI